MGSSADEMQSSMLDGQGRGAHGIGEVVNVVDEDDRGHPVF